MEDEKKELEGLEGKMTKGMRKKMRREEKKVKREQEKKAKERSRIIMRLSFLAIGAIVVFFGWRYFAGSDEVTNQDVQHDSQMESQEDSEVKVVAEDGVHWHTDIEMYVDRDQVEVPANIGLIAGHADMHTHVVNDQIHIEMSRKVRGRDVELGRFFSIWGKDFSSTCLLKNCTDDGGELAMTVNGEDNQEFDKYQMKDGDKIVINFDSAKEN